MSESYDWIAPTVTALGSLIASVVAAILSLKAGRRAAAAEERAIEAKDSAVEAKNQSVATAKAVDGKMTEVVALVTEKVTAEATLAEQAAERARKAEKALAAREAAPLVLNNASLSPAVERENGAHPDAKAILAEAATAAARLLIETAEIQAAALLRAATEERKP